MDHENGWAEVADDLIYILAKRLIGLQNIIRFGAVCRSWHALVQDKDHINSLGYKQIVPWLLLPENDQCNDGDREFFDLLTGEIIKLSLPLLHERRCAGSSNGWLITTGTDYQFHLLNPITGVQFELPNYYTFQSFSKFSPGYYDDYTSKDVRDCFLKKAVLSLSPQNREYIVMATHLGFDQTCISFTKSYHKEWINFHPHVDQEIAFVQDKFLSVSGLGKIHICDIDDEEPKLVEIACLPKDVCGYTSHYLVECDGKILIIARLTYYEHEHDNYDTPVDDKDEIFRTYRCRVYELMDLEDVNRSIKSEEDDGWGVVEITSIGDHALFLGKNNSICLSTMSNVKFLRRNCIYFTEDYLPGIMFLAEEGIYIGGFDNVMYNLDDKSFEPYYPGILKPSFCPPIWVTPNPW